MSGHILLLVVVITRGVRLGHVLHQMIACHDCFIGQRLQSYIKFLTTTFEANFGTPS